MGVGHTRLDADLHGHGGLSALVFAGVGADLSRRT
jgi:hypothetical protein